MNRWVILIGAGYGAFLFEGTEAEAEQMRSHKARWEGGIAKKRLADEAEIAADKPSQCWNHPGFKNKFVCRCDCDDEDCIAIAIERTKEPNRG